MWNWIWNVWNGFGRIWIGHAREMSEMCAWMYSWIDLLIHVDLCPGGFQHKSWRLHHDEIILAVAQEERDSLGSSRVHFCRCVRLVSGAGTSCTWNEMMWTYVNNMFFCLQRLDTILFFKFKKIAEFQHTSGSLTSLLGMCAFQVCRKQCCVLHFRVRTWEIPASLTCQKLPKWCCNSYRHMYCSFVHPLFYCILGALLQAQSPVIAGVKLSFFKGMMRPIEQDWSRPGSQEKLKIAKVDSEIPFFQFFCSIR